MKCNRIQCVAGYGVEVGMLVVELQKFKDTAQGLIWAGNHKAKLVRNIKKATAVVAQVEHKVCDVARLKLLNRCNKLCFRRSNMIVESQITNVAGVCF